MRSFSDDLLYTTVRLEGIKSNGSSVGTGFYFKYEDRYFLVTNKHVIKGVIDGHFIISDGTREGGKWSPRIGYGFRVNFTENSFHGHPNPSVDVAVMNITYFITKLEKEGKVPFFMLSSVEEIPTPDEIENSINAIEEVLFIGYPNGIWDSQNLLPIARKGITATPYYHDFNGEPKFLIDASVFPGSSGSPVFIFNAWSYKNKSGQTINKSRIHLLGIIAATYYRTEEGEIIIKDIPVKKEPISITHQMIDIGIVFNASTIVECAEDYQKIHSK